VTNARQLADLLSGAMVPMAAGRLDD
jgi:hypothetical protein